MGPLQYRRPPLGVCSADPSASGHQWALLGEAAFGFSEFSFFENSFSSFAHFMTGWLTGTPAHTTLSAQQFLTRNGTSPVPRPPYSLSLSRTTLLCFPHENVLPGKRSAHAEKVKQKTAEARKHITIDELTHL